MKELLKDVLIDTLKILPFLYMAFLIIEYIENKFSKEKQEKILKKQTYGPLLGGLLGMIPQCGFSVLATNLFSSRVITLGTLIAVYLSTSDEMLPLLLAGNVSILKSVKLVLFKALIGIIFGYIIDVITKKFISVKVKKESINDMCETNHCHCHDSIFKGALKHALNITLYIFMANLLLSLLINYIGNDKIMTFVSKGGVLSYFLSSLVGLIPNCASSVIITELYLNNVLSLGNMFSGLLTGCGMGLLVLFRTNKNIKENIFILMAIYVIGLISGYIIDIIGLVI